MVDLEHLRHRDVVDRSAAPWPPRTPSTPRSGARRPPRTPRSAWIPARPDLAADSPSRRRRELRRPRSSRSRNITTSPTTAIEVTLTAIATAPASRSHRHPTRPSATPSATRQTAPPTTSAGASVVIVALTWTTVGVLATSSVAPTAAQREAPSRRASRNVTIRPAGQPEDPHCAAGGHDAGHTGHLLHDRGHRRRDDVVRRRVGVGVVVPLPGEVHRVELRGCARRQHAALEIESTARLLTHRGLTGELAAVHVLDVLGLDQVVDMSELVDRRQHGVGDHVREDHNTGHEDPERPPGEQRPPRRRQRSALPPHAHGRRYSHGSRGQVLRAKTSSRPRRVSHGAWWVKQPHSSRTRSAR